MKVGIIGCGGIAPIHIETYKKFENIDVVSLCDLDINRAKNLANKYKITNKYSDYFKMLEKGDIDLVDICTPTSTHRKIVCDVASQVPSIMLEKPMARTVDECNQMIKELEKNDTKICIGHCQIFNPNIQKIKDIINSPNYKLYSFRTSLRESYEILLKNNLIAPWTVLPEQKGIIWEVCSHHAYLQLYFLPEISEVYAVGGKTKYNVYDDFTVLLRTKDDTYGLIEISWVPTEMDIIYEFRGREGRRIELHWEYDYIIEKDRYPEFKHWYVVKNIFSDQNRLIKKWLRFTYQYIKKRKLAPFHNMLNLYLDSIKNDLPSPVNAEDGRRTIHLLESIEKSLDEKRPITL